jgi:hypothetical protein
MDRQAAAGGSVAVAKFMAARFPEARSRLYLLGALDAGGPLFVPDPWARGADVYVATYRRITEALTAAITG